MGKTGPPKKKKAKKKKAKMSAADMATLRKLRASYDPGVFRRALLVSAMLLILFSLDLNQKANTNTID